MIRDERAFQEMFPHPWRPETGNQKFDLPNADAASRLRELQMRKNKR